MKKFLFGTALVLASSLFAQTSQKWSQTPHEILQSASAVKTEQFLPATMILNEENYTFDAAGRLTEIRHHIYRVERADDLGNWATTGARWEPWHQSRPQLNARVISASGGVTELDQKTIADAPANETSDDLFSDSRELNGPLPALAKGSIVEELTIITDTEPDFAAGIARLSAIAWRVPVERTRITIVHPESLPVKYNAFQLPDLKVSKQSANGIETIVLEQGPLSAVDTDDSNTPPGEALHAQIRLATGQSWQAIASAYAKLSEPKIRLADVASLVTDADRKLPRDARIAKLMQRLHKEVRYTGIEFGENSLIPQFPSQTLARHFGDCKDKATLLVTMLRAAGIPARLALLNASAQQADPELPGMRFDHAIVYVPAAGEDRDYWIDATSTFSALGSLPYGDYGRRALIVDEATTALTTMPELNAADNMHVEERRFDLAEDGPARVVETAWNTGPWDAWIRNSAFKRSKDSVDSYKKYIRSAYLSDNMGKLEYGEPTDMDHRFQVSIEALKARRGATDFDNAVAAILPFEITNDLPNAVRYEEDKKAEKKPRGGDFFFYPSISEWRYVVHPPLGYKVRPLPPNVDRQLATAHLTETFSQDKNGNVTAVLRFETGKGRLTTAESDKLRDALAELRNAPAIMLGFDMEARAMIDAGKVKEGLAEFEKLSAAHPKEALHRIQQAAALVDLGMGEHARSVAKTALELEPNFAKGHMVYAQILERDLIGRRFKPGFDYEGAIAEYRKAKALDPEDKDLRINLAILLEHGPQGRQYQNARLDEALKEWAELKAMDEEYIRRYDNNALFDLWRLDRYQELQDRIATLPTDDSRRQLLLASIAIQISPEASIERARSLVTDRNERAKLLAAVGTQLLYRRKYAASAALYRAAAADTDSAARYLNFAQVLEKTTRLEDRPAESPVIKAMIDDTVLTSRDDATIEQIRKIYSRTVLTVLSPAQLDRKIKAELASTLAISMKSEMSMPLLLDIAFGSAHFSTEGDDQVGYQLVMTTQNSQADYNYFIKEDGVWNYVADKKTPSHMGGVILDALDRGDLTTARRWLDWARDRSTAGGSLDDSLTGNVFARFWTKGQQADAAAMRRAAIALVRNSEYAKKIAPEMPRLFAHPSPADAAKYLLLRADVAKSAQRWEEMHELGTELLKLFPESKVAADFVIDSGLRLKKYDEVAAVYAPFKNRDPKDHWVINGLAEIEKFRGDFAAAQKVLLPMVEDGTATESDLNGYAWYSLFTPNGVDKTALEAGERGMQLKANSFPVMHTVACMYAEVGRGKEAYNLLLQAMDSASMPEPQSEVWYTLGRIAESYGEYDSAMSMYKKVEHYKEFPMDPTETYLLAHRHMDTVNALLKPPPSKAAQTSAK